jgi:hypothetical protein
MSRRFGINFSREHGPLSLTLSHEGRGNLKPPSLDGRGWGRVQGDYRQRGKTFTGIKGMKGIRQKPY